MPAILMDDEGRIVASNDGAISLFGLSILNLNHITVLRQPRLLDAIEKTSQDRTRRTSIYLQTKGALDVSWRVSLSSVFTPNAPQQLLAIFEDVTIQTEAAKARREFVSNVSHELRTPLTAVLGFVETLRGAARDDPTARDRFLEIIEAEATRMATLVRDLSSLSHVEEQGRQKPLDHVSLTSIVTNSLSTLGSFIDEANVEVLTELPDQEVMLPGDAGQLLQVMINLIENAVKYGNPQGQIILRLTGPLRDPQLMAQAYTLSVTDDGDGIPAHAISRLTDRFFRLDSHRSREVGGTGLGLAIVKHIIQRHHGRLQIDSVVSEGSTFSVILPSE